LSNSRITQNFELPVPIPCFSGAGLPAPEPPARNQGAAGKAARELGISTLELSKRLGISQPTASQSVKRGEKTVKEMKLQMAE